MAIRKPKVSANEARKLSEKSLASGDKDVVSRLGKKKKGVIVTPAKPNLTKSPLPSSAKSIGDTQKPKATPKPRRKTKGASPEQQVSKKPAIPVQQNSAKVKQGISSKAANSQPRNTEKQQIFLSALVPLPGISPSFDQLTKHYSPSKALQMILRRAMSDFEIKLANGTYKSAPSDYEVPLSPEDQVMVQTSRVMPLEYINLAYDHFDPLGFESMRAVGFKLATTALATFFKSENQR